MSTYVATSRNSAETLEDTINAILVNPLAVNGLVAVCLTILFTVSDAFETGHLTISHQVTLWLTFSILLVSQLYGLNKGLLAKFSNSFLQRVLAIGFSVVLTVILMTIELHFLKFTPLLPKEPDPFFEFLIFIARPVVAASALVLLAQLIPIQQQIKSYQLHALKAIQQAADANELDKILNSYSVQHVQVHDHYLEINCPDQRFFVRGSMKDALTKLSGSEGIQIHRSHWVAKNFIKHIRREGRDVKVVLNNNAIVPVARSRFHLLKI